MELAGMGTTSRQAFEVAVEYVTHAKAAISAMVVDDPARPAVHVKSDAGDGAAADELHFDASIAAPPRVRSRGRPKELRYKSPIESPGARKRPAATTTGGLRMTMNNLAVQLASSRLAYISSSTVGPAAPHSTAQLLVP
jgi:hypothetical protein